MLIFYRRNIATVIVLASLQWGYASVAFASLAKGSFALKKKKYSEAAFHYFNAIDSTSTKNKIANAELGLARAFVGLSWLASASYYLKRIIKASAGKGRLFELALEELYKLDVNHHLGYKEIATLLPKKFVVGKLNPHLASFVNFYVGKDLINRGRFKEAENLLKKVTQTSYYYKKALFHRGVALHFLGDSKAAIASFESLVSQSSSKQDEWIRSQALLNIARVFYEKSDYFNSIKYYSQVKKNSELWLTAVFEGAWAFFLMKKPNNTLGNIHTLQSPFFSERYFPESNILQAVTLLRFCMFAKVKESLSIFKELYTKPLSEMNDLLKASRKNIEILPNLIAEIESGDLKEYPKLKAIFIELSNNDIVKMMVERNSLLNSESELINKTEPIASSPHKKRLNVIVKRAKKLAVRDYSGYLRERLNNHQNDLNKLHEQVKLIDVEMLLGQIDTLRRQLNFTSYAHKGNFIGGMQPLKIGQKLEYWPFDGEYWKDELGGYVYNLESHCPR